MGKGKSSATSATRKKHAKKSAPPPEEPTPKTKKEKKARGNKEPRQKIYIPPVKPAPVQPDPLETTGLAHSLPADLVVVLRSFNKKAEATKVHALEELQAGWVDKCGEDEMVGYRLAEMLPVWLHHVPALFLHPSRRVRALTATLHLSLLQIPSVKEQVFFFLRETASQSQAESLLGSWCVAANEVDKAVATAAMKSWKEAMEEFKLDEAPEGALLEFVQRTALDPAGIYTYLNPVQPSVTLTHPKKGYARNTPLVQPRNETPKAEENEENEQDRKARLRFGALGALRWILESVEKVPLSLFGNPAFLTSLQPRQSVSWVAMESFGYGQPTVRKNAWALLLTLFSTRKGQLQDVASELARSILRSAFIETDSNVQSTMWYPLLLFLKEFPNSWELEVKASQQEDDDQDSENENEEGSKPMSTSPASAAYQEFLQFLQLGCSGSPIQGYPTVVIILSTISSAIIAVSSSTPLDDFFSSFWAALDGRALTSVNRAASSAALLSSLLECMILILKRLRSRTIEPEVVAKLLGAEGGKVNADEFSKKLMREQLAKMWQEILDVKLEVTEELAAKSIVKAVDGLREVDPELSEAAWDILSSKIFSSSLTHPTLASRLVRELRSESQGSQEWASRLDSVLAKLAEQSLGGYSAISTTAEGESGKQQQALLKELLNTFKQNLFAISQAFRDGLDAIISNGDRTYELLKASPPVFLAILRYRGLDGAGIELAQAAWKSVQGNLARGDTPKAEREGVWKVLVHAAQMGTLPEYLRVHEQAEGEGALDDLVGRSVLDVVGGSEDGVDVLRGVLDYHGFFISTSAFLGIFEAICSSLKSEVKAAFEDPFFLPSEGGRSGAIPWGALETLFSLALSTYKVTLGSPHSTSIASAIDSVAPDAFLFAYLLPLCEGIRDEGPQTSFEVAKQIWAMWYKDALDTDKDTEKGKSRASRGLREVRERLKAFILGTETRVLPQTVLTLLLTPEPSNDGKTGGDAFFFFAHPEFGTDNILEFLPAIEELDAMLTSFLPNVAPNASMGVLEPLVPSSTAYPYSLPVRVQSSLPGDMLGEGTSATGDVDMSGYDRYGYSAYARAVSALVSVFARDRACVRVREGVEMLRHVGVLEVYAWDGVCLPDSLGSMGTPQRVFGETVPIRESEVEDQMGGGAREGAWSLAELIPKIEQVSAYAFLAAGGREPWKRYVMESLAGATARVPPSTSGNSSVDEAGNMHTGGIKKTTHATMNLLSWFVLDVIARSVQSEVDLKAGVAVGIRLNGKTSAKDEVKGMKNKVVLKARVLRRMLERVFDDDEDEEHNVGPGVGPGVGKEEVDAWVGYARRIERIAPLTSSTILATLTSLGLDSPRFDRARNEFAASLLGVLPPKANTEGLELLRALGLCVPNDDSEDDEAAARITTGSNGVSLGGRRGLRRGGSDVIMLPVQRAVNVVKACQKWVEGQEKVGADSDEEGSEDEEEGPSEDLESAMLAVSVGLAPILQNVPGKHWDFMWDVVETVLENSTLEDETTLLSLSHALRLVRVMEELVRTNKQLKADWSKRRVAVLRNVRDLLLEGGGDSGESANSKSSSVPRAICRLLILSIVQSLPDELMDQNTLGKMCHLATDSSIEVQRLSYGMLRQAAEKRTQWIVIEVGVGSMGTEVEATARAASVPADQDAHAPSSDTPAEPEVQPVPPPSGTKEEDEVEKKEGSRRKQRKEVVVKDAGPSLLPKELLDIIERGEEGDLFGWMLGWMLVFDLFKDASFKVKSMYIEQLRNLDLIGSSLLPVIVYLLRLDEGLNKAVKVDLWAVDEFYVAYYDPVSAPALAAHLYYRALLSVPSLIHAWVLACKDRQLTLAITTLTSTQFSPLLIRRELAHLKSSEGLAELSGEGLSVKVIGGGGSGVGGEVVAAYAVDEHQLELRLRIPGDWPLHKMEVRDEKRVGVDENRWRAWVLGVQQTIWTHNGRIVDGLSLWKKNVIGHFEGQVECAICYSIISASDGALPKNPCKTCKNRFHAGCLYKWFNTSHSSSCPLCRSNII